MKKIGILTMYYKSENYGGVLQAYALTKYFNKVGLSAEQICFDRYPVSLIYFLRRRLKYFIRAFICFLHIGKIPFLRTNKSIYEWAMKYVAHSKKIYNKKTISCSNDDYDVFVAGSDQIWTEAFSKEFLLDFVHKDKSKVSYAASIGRKNISEPAKEHFKSSLSDFSLISIREKESADLLKKITGYNIEWCIDPTLLLSKEEWNRVCGSDKIQEKYIFCYFLGDDIRLREMAKQFSERKGLKIVNIPYLQMQYNKADSGFGDYCISNANPADFINLIKNADYILTDSFHACVFSYIFQKEYYVFDRVSFPEMNIRIRGYLQLFNALDHFIEEKNFSVPYINSLPPINYSVFQDLLKSCIEDSKEYISRIKLL